MAKKKTRTVAAGRSAKKKAPSKMKARDKRTMDQIVGLGDSVVNAATRRREPQFEVPTRSLSNVRYNKSKRIIEMGRNTTRRQLFNLSPAFFA